MRTFRIHHLAGWMILLGTLSLCAQRSAPILGMDPMADVVDHAVFDSLWRASKTAGRLSTQAVLSTAYQQYRQAIAEAIPTAYLPHAQTAFWVNAYLACLMEVLHYRVGYRTALWDSTLLVRDTFIVAGQPHTLRTIGDALVAAAGTVRARAFLCTGSDMDPPFPRHACTARTARTQMHEQLRRLCRNRRYLRYDAAGRVLQLGSMFRSWQSAEEKHGTYLVDLLLPWMAEETAAGLALAGDALRVHIVDRLDQWQVRR